jgi:predicted nucleotidyltransferase
MPINTNVNLQVVEKIAKALGDLTNEVLFIGGAVVSLYATDPAADQVRPTKDIDISVQIGSYLEMNKLSVRLATKGFYPAPEGTILYRYKFEDVLIDFIPYEPTTLGPTNSWLKPGFAVALSHNVGEQQINILPVTYFLASKWEAFLDRGKKDPRTSPDFEDFIYIVDNHLEIVKIMEHADDKVKPFLMDAFKFILNHSHSDEIIECQLSPIIATQRGILIQKKLKAIIYH